HEQAEHQPGPERGAGLGVQGDEDEQGDEETRLHAAAARVEDRRQGDLEAQGDPGERREEEDVHGRPPCPGADAGMRMMTSPARRGLTRGWTVMRRRRGWSALGSTRTTSPITSIWAW